VTEIPSVPGQYVIRVCLHDDTIYHSIAHSHIEKYEIPGAPDIIVDDEIRLKYRFKDIIDNPIFRNQFISHNFSKFEIVVRTIPQS
jgi:hypothetical protein